MLYPGKINMTQLHNPLKALRYTEFRTVFSETTGKPLQRRRSVLKGGGWEGGGGLIFHSAIRIPLVNFFQNIVYVVC